MKSYHSQKQKNGVILWMMSQGDNKNKTNDPILNLTPENITQQSGTE